MTGAETADLPEPERVGTESLGGAPDEAAGTVRVLARLRSWIPSRLLLFLIAFASLCAALLEALIIGVIAAAAAAVAQSEDEVSISIGPVAESFTVPSTAVFGIILTVGMVGLRILASRATASLVSRLLVHIRIEALTGYMQSRYEEQVKTLPGELHDLLVFQSMRMSQAMQRLLGGLNGLLSFFGLVVMAILIDPLIAGVLIVVSTTLAVGFLPLIRRSKKAGGAHLSAQVDVGVDLGDVGGLLAEAHVYRAQDGLLRRAAGPIQRAGDAFRTSAFVAGISPVLYLGSTFLLLLTGVLLLDVAGADDLDRLGAIVLLTLRGLRYSQQVQSQAQAAVELSNDVASVTDNIDRFRAARPQSGGDELSRVESLELRNVGYTYPGTGDGMTGVSMTLHRGDIVGVVGHSGAGKSTFAEVVLGLRQPSSGEVLVNGRARMEFELADWFDRVAYVGQEPRLLAGTVADNVAFFRDVTSDRLDRALDAASLRPDMGRWDVGDARQVGSGGRDVSGGQRQRMAIARALVGEPDVLVLDEPTSALDEVSEAQIRSTIAALSGNVLVIVIAHRRSTLEACDRVVEFTNGEAVEVPVARLTSVVVE